MARALPTNVADYVGPVLGALVFVVLMSLVREPARRNFNAVFVGGAMGAYLNGGFGAWELVFAALGVFAAYLGLRSHRFIGLAWLMHSAWDLVHHLFGNAIWPFMQTSSFGCMIFDASIAVWFLNGAPSVRAFARSKKRCKRSVMRGGKRVTEDIDRTLSQQMIKHALRKLQLCLDAAKKKGLVSENVARGRASGP